MFDMFLTEVSDNWMTYMLHV